MDDKISIIPSHQLDKKKWNSLLSQCRNSLIYARTEYLDHLCDHWTGLVLNDYEAVMPVPWRKKFGIVYTYDVPFIQQLGIYADQPEKSTELFKKAMFSFCKYGDYNFNYSTPLAGGISRSNFILSLDLPVDTLMNSFTSDTRQNIRKAVGNGLTYTPAETDEAIDSYRELYAGRLKKTSESEFQSFRTLSKIYYKNGEAIVRKVTSGSGKVLAILLLLKDGRRLYNLMNSTFPEGRNKEANYFLLYSVWKEFEQLDLVFDFEGSDISGIQEFYKKFGASRELYPSIHFNNLPWPLKYFKK